MIINENYLIYGFDESWEHIILQTGDMAEHILAFVLPIHTGKNKILDRPVVGADQIENIPFDRIGIIPEYSSEFERWNASGRISGHKILDMGILVHRFKKSLPRTSFGFEVSLVEHCNLNCMYCLHFSPLAKPAFASVKKVEKDMSRLAELTDGKVDTVKLLGGEPLLHPQLEVFLKMSRSLFPDCDRIRLNTNGILLPRQPEEFWKICAARDIILEITKYPVNVDYDKCVELAEKYHIRYYFCGLDEDGVKRMTHKRIDIDGNLDGQESFMRCRRGAICNLLYEGRLYPCPAPVAIRHFSEYFHKTVFAEDHDGIDIYEIREKEEVLRFLENPIPFCRHCDIAGMRDGLPWQESQRKITEWC